MNLCRQRRTTTIPTIWYEDICFLSHKCKCRAHAHPQPDFGELQGELDALRKERADRQKAHQEELRRKWMEKKAAEEAVRQKELEVQASPNLSPKWFIFVNKLSIRCVGMLTGSALPQRRLHASGRSRPWRRIS